MKNTPIYENAGYLIKEQITMMNETYVLGHNPNSPAPYVTWSADLAKDYFVYGHYFKDEASARQDLIKRALENLPEKETDEMALSLLSDEGKESIIKKAREDVALEDIKYNLPDALDEVLDTLDRDDLVYEGTEPILTALTKDEKFMKSALEAYYRIDHSFDNECLVNALSAIMKEDFPELIQKEISSLDDLINDAFERTIATGSDHSMKKNEPQLDI